jgi:hypothetical protein
VSKHNVQFYEKWNRGGKHKWITKAIAEALPSIGTTDHLPPEKVKIAFKLFNPQGAGSWYITEANLELGEAFGWADLGHGGELGYMDLNEMRAYKGRFGLPLERDEWFSGTLADVMKKEAA